MSEPPPIPPVNPAPEAAGQVPTCPRHPDRESYVRCQRCGRPACPECQRPAAVGIHCVDCVREASKTVRQGRTTFGGAVTDGRPLVTFWLIGICVAVYLLQTVQPSLTRDIAFAPVVGDTQPWRFITSGFAHGGLTHIAFNMYALYVMGQYLEPMLGRARYIALYLLSAFGGSVGILLLASKPAGGVATLADESWFTAAVGASGAVFGLFGAFLVLQRRLGRSAAGCTSSSASTRSSGSSSRHRVAGAPRRPHHGRRRRGGHRLPRPGQGPAPAAGPAHPLGRARWAVRRPRPAAVAKYAL